MQILCKCFPNKFTDSDYHRPASEMPFVGPPSANQRNAIRINNNKITAIGRTAAEATKIGGVGLALKYMLPAGSAVIKIQILCSSYGGFVTYAMYQPSVIKYNAHDVYASIFKVVQTNKSWLPI